MNISSAQYVEEENVNVCIRATINNIELWVPLDPKNTHYAEIMRQVETGELTIADAD